MLARPGFGTRLIGQTSPIFLSFLDWSLVAYCLPCLVGRAAPGKPLLITRGFGGEHSCYCSSSKTQIADSTLRAVHIGYFQAQIGCQQRDCSSARKFVREDQR